MDFSAARGIADAVFYEGFLLYPYTASAPKNKLRWQFGVVAPMAQADAGTGEYGHQQTEVLFESGTDTRIDLVFRFLHVEARRVEALRGGEFVPMPALNIAGTTYLTFDETCEREVAAEFTPAPESGSGVQFAIAFPGARSIEELRDPEGVLAGRVVRERWPVSGIFYVETTAANATIDTDRMPDVDQPGATLDAEVRRHADVTLDQDRKSDGVQVVVKTLAADKTLPVDGRLDAKKTSDADKPSAAHGSMTGKAIRRLRIRVENTSDVVAAPERGVVPRTAFVSAHTLAGISGGAFWSPIDPPDPARAAGVPVANEHTWPVLVGDRTTDERRAAIVLSSPIILSDFPAIAHNTRADAFDATEIDELLNLSVLSLSDAERAEARATHPRARAIVERAEAFDAADVARTHAQAQPVPAFEAIHPRRQRQDFDAVPVFETPGHIEEPAAPLTVDVGGVAVTKGSSVRLAPKRRADAWDMFLAGKTATVQAIHQDFEDKIYVAVTVDDDPASEYHQWYGRSFFFEPDEVEPLGTPA